MSKKKLDFPLHLISMNQLERKHIEFLFSIVSQCNQEECRNIEQKLRNKVIANLFFQPSTRTRLSYETAILKLGGQSIGFKNSKILHSRELLKLSLEDIISIISQMVDGIILRHSHPGSPKVAASLSLVPLINAGDGTNEHPTRALVDLWMMYKNLSGLDDATVGLVGDPNTRVLRSFVIGLTKFNIKAILFFLSPNVILSQEIINLLENHNIKWVICDDFQEVLDKADVVEIPPVFLQNRITKKELFAVRRKIPILDPVMWQNEIDRDVDSIFQTLYFKQVKQGMLIHMALLETMLGK